MRIIGIVAQLVISLGIFNVWFLRFNKSTGYRAGSAGNMQQEFAAYGLPGWFMWVIGGLKVALAILLIIGIWMPTLIVPAAGGMAVLMIGAIGMHLKVGDSLKKSLPASAMLLLSLIAMVSGYEITR
jgi:uncharacterized membrane protein YphA (DoxX/SURF4 family)